MTTTTTTMMMMMIIIIIILNQGKTPGISKITKKNVKSVWQWTVDSTLAGHHR